jgi:hypothetical protein
VSDRPILFSAPMVRALLAGMKTQTRRVVKRPLKHPNWTTYRLFGPSVNNPAQTYTLYECGPDYPDGDDDKVRCPYADRPGDRLWVRETWMPDPPIDDSWASTAWSGCGRTVSEIPERFHHPRFCNYAADWLHGPIRWTPSIHMPRWASRITLEITGVRVERLQDISDADSIAEGAVGHPDGPWHAYRSLWTLINGPGSWDANPWVWVIEFCRATAGGAG